MPAAALQPDLLLLDEPTNHLDAESVAWLERTLQDYPGTVVAVTHDRYFLDNVAGWILELDRGFGIPWEGNYTSWLEQKQARLAGEEKADRARQRTLERGAGVGAHVAPSPPEQGQGPDHRLQRPGRRGRGAAERAGRQARDHHPARSPPRRRGGRGGGRDQGFGDRLLIEGLSFLLPPGGIVGRHRPERRRQDHPVPHDRRHRGARRRRAPHRATRCGWPTSTSPATSSTADNTVFEEVAGGQDRIVVGGRELHGRAYVAGFGFKGSDQQKKVGDLSGGERNRVHLAKVLRSGGNVLLLDEPTNDLDVDTLRALEDALLAFPGCAVIISHDRWFLDRVATHVLAFEGDSAGALVGGQLLATTRPTATSASASTPTSRTASGTSLSFGGRRKVRMLTLTCELGV